MSNAAALFAGHRSILMTGGGWLIGAATIRSLLRKGTLVISRVEHSLSIAYRLENKLKTIAQAPTLQMPSQKAIF